jgi:NADH:ubiquinone oxidoreductase subunit 6 (subunit J)
MVFLEILILISAISVMLAPSLIRSSLFLMLTFLLSGVFLASIGAEILALLFLLVYIGAISVLFLFVIMLVQLTRNQVAQYTINPNDEATPNFNLTLALLGFVLIVLFIYLIFLTLTYTFPITYNLSAIYKDTELLNVLYTTSEVHSLGAVLFIDYWLAFIIATFIIILVSFGVIIILK